MRKYHIADALTLTEVIFSITIFGMTLAKTKAEYVFLAFLGGELCDAFDGIAARRWHYPDDGKYRWWRRYNVELDILSDIMLAVSVACYLIAYVNRPIGIFLTALLTGNGIVISLWTRRPHWRQTKTSGTVRFYDLNRTVILARRYVYLAGLTIAAIMILWASTWSEITKWLILCAGVIIGTIMAFVKQDRLTEDKTPL